MDSIRGSLGCAVAGGLLLLVLYFLSLLMLMIEPGVGILIMFLGIFVAAGTVVALVIWIAGMITSRGRD